jgi:hypothetical protein
LVIFTFFMLNDLAKTTYAVHYLGEPGSISDGNNSYWNFI